MNKLCFPFSPCPSTHPPFSSFGIHHFSDYLFKKQNVLNDYGSCLQTSNLTILSDNSKDNSLTITERETTSEKPDKYYEGRGGLSARLTIL